MRHYSFSFRLFYEACTAPAWMVSVEQAGHFQFLDKQSSMQRAVCAQGRAPDYSVRQMSQVSVFAHMHLCHDPYIVPHRPCTVSLCSERLSKHAALFTLDHGVKEKGMGAGGWCICCQVHKGQFCTCYKKLASVAA